jgi:hypothetical protein
MSGALVKDTKKKKFALGITLFFLFKHWLHNFSYSFTILNILNYCPGALDNIFYMWNIFFIINYGNINTWCEKTSQTKLKWVYACILPYSKRTVSSRDSNNINDQWSYTYCILHIVKALMNIGKGVQYLSANHMHEEVLNHGWVRQWE